MRNRTRLEKKLAEEKKKNAEMENRKTKNSKARGRKEQQHEAKRRLESEVLHLNQEAETEALGRAMMADAKANRPTFNNSCLKLPHNFQGKKLNLHYNYLKNILPTYLLCNFL